MITKEQLSAALTRECDIAKHLFTKLSPESYSYQPSPKQRTTLQLMQYLSVCGVAALQCAEQGSWKAWQQYSERAQAMAAEEFPAAMDLQKAEIEQFFASVSEETLRTKMAPMPAGGELPLGLAIVEGPLKWLSAYKLQLFLYAKATGATNIGTSNAWGGVDRA